MAGDLDYLEVIREINIAIKTFEHFFEKGLNLIKVLCPLFVKTKTGLQDNLSGTEKAVTFLSNGENFEVVHSLAKWKREALKRYKIPKGSGIYTNMKAIRKSETIDSLHSLLVDQWDWEKVISKENRNIEYLKITVREIYKVIKDVSEYLRNFHGFTIPNLPPDIFFISSKDLEDIYPSLVPAEREENITKSKGAVFIMQIGGKLKSGIPHDLRSPDYDDWDLNGDLLLLNGLTDTVMEFSSMGIRVDKFSLKKQLVESGFHGSYSPYQEKILNDELPYTIGGGIGQSRLLMFLLNKKHIAQVQASFWDNVTDKEIENLMPL